MKDSSRSSGRRRTTARRKSDRRSRARRLGIETMEGRVLLSGNSLDLSTFGADLVPVTDFQSTVTAAASTDVNANSLFGDSSRFQYVLLREGGVANMVPTSTRGQYDGNRSVTFATSTDNAVDSVFGNGISLNAHDGPEIGVVAKSSDGDLHSPNPGETQAQNASDLWRVDFETVWQPAAITPEWSNAVAGHTVSIQAEGGSISVASLAAAFSRPSNAPHYEFMAKEVGDDVNPDLQSSELASDPRSFASVQVEGEWARAMAMESVSAEGATRSADQHESRESGIRQGSRGPLSTSDARTSADGERAANVTASGPLDPLIGVPLSAERRADSLQVTPVAFSSAGERIGGDSLLAPAHRLGVTGRGVRSRVEIDRSAANLSRDEAFSEWRASLVDDAILRPVEPGDQRLWVNPGPFLAVLALERFVAMEPGDKESHCIDRRSLKRVRQ
jgi:hypothetical protein